MKILLILFVCQFLIVSCLSDNDSLSNKELNYIRENSFNNLHEVDPIIFLKSLTSDVNSPVTVMGVSAAATWIQEAHLAELMSLIESDVEAAPVVDIASSYYPLGESSTIGNEAMYLIEGYRVGRYPPSLCSLHYFDGDVQYYKDWWNNRKQ